MPPAPIRALRAAAALLACGAAAAPAPRHRVPYGEALARARAIVARMTLEEKISQVHGTQDEAHRRFVPGVPRLGIPPLRITNGPAGAGPGDPRRQEPATALPAPIALAASWDPALARLYGRIAGEEARDLGNDLLESPDVNIARVPQGGRVFEGFGEDPYLAARIAVAEIQGIQGTGVLANVKHFDANNQENARHTIDEVIAERTLHEIYLPAFEAAVEEARVASVMAAYPRINGAFCCENRMLLTDVLAGEWGFDGFVTSDFHAVHSTVPSALAGLDLELPQGVYFAEPLRRAVEDGKVPMAVLDRMLARRYAKMIEFGWFDDPPGRAPIPEREDGALARRIADRGIVLLKNDGGLLPLDPRATRSVALFGDFASGAATGGGGSSRVVPLYAVTPAEGLRAALPAGASVSVFAGDDPDAAAAAAGNAGVAIVMVGDRETEGSDHGIALAAREDRLVEAVAEANPRTVVVVKSGSAVLMPWHAKAAAIVEAWYPGEEDGNAVADVLFGKVNPSGKLPLTFPVRVADTLARDPKRYPGVGGTVRYSEGLYVGYRGYNAQQIEPLFPFGFGLSYTSFAFYRLKVEVEPGKDAAAVSCEVKNTGARAGADVVQLYLAFPPILEGDEPPRQLRGFRKVLLEPGETRTVEFRLDRRAFSYWSERTHGWTVPDGTFQVRIGDSSAYLPLGADMNLRRAADRSGS